MSDSAGELTRRLNRATDIIRDLIRTRALMAANVEHSSEYEAAWRAAKEFLAELTPGTEPKK